ncbi:MAG TPA: hypothetical protein VFN91_05440, partial [Myxococcaceae bacterium]|nr:hypothetical protein [Myxococcaceae bacterium]
SGRLFARRLYEVPARVYSLDPVTGDRRPFAIITPPDASSLDWVFRLKVAASGSAIGFSYAFRQGRVLMLSWGEPSR